MTPLPWGILFLMVAGAILLAQARLTWFYPDVAATYRQLGWICLVAATVGWLLIGLELLPEWVVSSELPAVVDLPIGP